MQHNLGYVDISRFTDEHTSIMNAAEGFFAVTGIVRRALLFRLLSAGVSWKWLYAIAGAMLRRAGHSRAACRISGDAAPHARDAPHRHENP
jgi:hypothetical protein